MFGMKKKEEELPEPPKPTEVVKVKAKSILQQQGTIQEQILKEFQEVYGSLGMDDDKALSFGIYCELRLIRDLLAAQAKEKPN